MLQSHDTRLGGKIVALATTQNQHSSGQPVEACSTSTIDNESDGFDAVSFRPIRTDFDGPFLHSKCYMAAATHDEEVRCGAGGHPKSTVIRTATSLYLAPPPSRMRAWL